MDAAHAQIVRFKIEEVRRAASEGRLRFVLGAGINVPYGLPRWTDLIGLLVRSGFRHHGMAAKVLDHAPAELAKLTADPLVAASIVEQLAGTHAHWNDGLVQALRPDEKKIGPADPSGPLAVIADIAVAQAELVATSRS